MIQLCRVYDPPASPAGHAVFVDRLWPRGFKKEAAWWDEWLPEVAPSPELRRWFGHDPARFAAFADRYRLELAGPERRETLVRLASYPLLTLAYAAKDPEHNHARVLREVLSAQA